MEKKIPDEVYNGNWMALINLFKKINRFAEGAKEKFQSLIEMAKIKQLTPRQVEGIVARCQYQIHLIDNPTEEPFSNMEKEEKRSTYQLPKEQANGKQ